MLILPAGGEGATPEGLTVRPGLEVLDRMGHTSGPHHWGWTGGASGPQRWGRTGGAGPEGHIREATPEGPQWRVITRGAIPEDHTGRFSLLFMQSPCEQLSSPSLISGPLSVNKGAQHLAAGVDMPTLAVMSCVRTCEGYSACVSSPPSSSPGVMG